MISTQLFLFSFALLSSITQARIGGSGSSSTTRAQTRRRLQHRKLESAPDEWVVPGQYIIVFEPNETEEEMDGLLKGWLRNAFGARVQHRFHSALNGVVVRRLSINILRLILSDKRVLYVEEVSLLWSVFAW